ncbi:MAG: MMPL family transporter [Pseudomonadota bacterium]
MVNRNNKRSFYRKIMEFIVYHPKTVLLLVLAATLFFAWQLPKLSIRTSIYDLVVEDLPETKKYAAFRKLFGSDEIIRVVIKGKRIFEPTTFQKVAQLAEEVSKIRGVRRIISLPGVKDAVDINREWDMDKFAAILSPIELFQNNVISADGSTTSITLVLTEDADKEAVIREVDRIISRTPKDLFLYQIGMPLVSEAMSKFTENDLRTLTPITFLVMAVILFFIFRNFFVFLIPLGCVVFSLVWTFGLMSWIQVPMSMLTMIIPVFLLAVGTGYCLHISNEFISNWRHSDSKQAAVLDTFSTMTLPTLMTVLTTVIGVGSLLTNRMEAIREFAFFSSFGMISLLILIFTFLPAAFSLVPASKTREKGKTTISRATEWFCEKVAEVNINKQKVVYPVLGCITLFCAAGIFMVRVETNPVEFFKKDSAISRNFHDIYRHLSGSFPVHVNIESTTENAFEDPKMIKEIGRIQSFLDRLPGVDKSISFADYLKVVNYAMNQFDAKYYSLPEDAFEVRMLINNYKIMLGEDMLWGFVSRDFSKMNILLLTHLSSSDDFLKIKARIQEYVRKDCPKNLSSDVTGIGVVISASGHILTTGQVKSLFLTMSVIFLIMFLLFLSFKVGLIAIVPNVFPIVVLFGIMGWLRIELSAATSLIASIAIGLAVDDTIHYLVCFNREFKKVLNDEQALRQTLKKIGSSMIFTTLLISSGFTVLIFSNFKPTMLFGILMVITMISALAGDLLLTPSLMLHVELVTIWDLVRVKLGKDPQEGIPLFRNLSRTGIHHILMAGALRPFQKGDVICRKGESSDMMYAIISGNMDVINPLADDACGSYSGEKVIAGLKVGDVVGEMGLFRGAPRSATVVATSPGEMLPINQKMIKRLQFLYPGTANQFFFNLVTILCDKLDRMTQCYAAESFMNMDTGQFSARGFFEILEREVDLARRYKVDLSLCLMEVEFKTDGGGLDPFTKDEILGIAGRVLCSTIRKSDLLGRLESNLFGIIFLYSNVEKAQEICARMGRQIKKEALDKKGANLTVNNGIVGYTPGDVSDETELLSFIKKANSALEKARRTLTLGADQKD